jgi:hypothetical protein
MNAHDLDIVGPAEVIERVMRRDQRALLFRDGGDHAAHVIVERFQHLLDRGIFRGPEHGQAQGVHAELAGELCDVEHLLPRFPDVADDEIAVVDEIEAAQDLEVFPDLRRRPRRGGRS